jgi:hypothetical protein
MKKTVGLTIALSLITSSLLAGVNADIELDPIIEDMVSGKRIVVKANIDDKAGIDVARTYFKASDGANYSFIPMTCEETECSSTLPAPSAATKSIDYLVLVKNKENVVYKTQTFTATQLPKDSDVPAYQIDPTDEAVHVKTELAQAPDMVEGFGDNVTVDAVEDTARFGVVAGLYGSSAESVAAAGTATSTVSGGTVAASAVGIGTTTLVVGGVVATVAAGGAAAAAVANSSSSNDAVSYSYVEPITNNNTLQGASGDPRVNLAWNNSNDLDLFVTDPCGKELYYSSKTAVCNSYSGVLDVDANVNSNALVSNPQENITWSNGGAIGTYTVRVNDSQNRTSGSTSYTVTIINNGVTQTYSGTISAGGSKDITSFTH